MTNNRRIRRACVGIGLLLVLVAVEGVALSQAPPPAGDAPKGLWAAAAEGDPVKVRRLIRAGAAPDEHDGRGKTPLIYASHAGHVEIVNLLLDAGADVNRLSRNALGPLAFAAKKGHADVVRLLLRRGADPNKISNGAKRNTPALVFAAAEERTELARLLIEAGADVDRTGSADAAPLYFACVDGNTALAKLLLRNGADPVRRGWGRTQSGRRVSSYPLVPAAAQGHEKIVEMLLKYDGAVIRDPRWRFDMFQGEPWNASVRLPQPAEGPDPKPLEDAIRAIGYYAQEHPADFKKPILERLLRLEDGAAAWRLDGSMVKGSALARAAGTGALAKLDRLLKEEPNPSMKDLALALRLAEQEGRMGAARRLRPIAQRKARFTEPLDLTEQLHWAVQSRDHRAAVRLVLRGADPKATDDAGYTALHWAAGEGDIRMIRFLLDRGAAVDRTNDYGRTPIGTAATDEKLEAMRFLLEHGGEVAPADLMPALVACAGNGHTDQVRDLLARGADPNGRAPWGGNPDALTSAAKHGHAAVVKLLIDRGAEVNNGPDGDSEALAWARNQRRNRIAAMLESVGAREASMRLPPPLDLPVRRYRTDRVKALLAQGVRPDVRLKLGDTALDYALHWGQAETSLALLDAGAELTRASDTAGESDEPVHQPTSSLRHGVRGMDESKLGRRVIRRLLQRGARAGLPSGYRRWTPIMQAARLDKTMILQMLLEQTPRADLQRKDEDGRTALQWAIKRHHQRAAAILRRAGATE